MRNFSYKDVICHNILAQEAAAYLRADPLEFVLYYIGQKTGGNSSPRQVRENPCLNSLDELIWTDTKDGSTEDCLASFQKMDEKYGNTQKCK